MSTVVRATMGGRTWDWDRKTKAGTKKALAQEQIENVPCLYACYVSRRAYIYIYIYIYLYVCVCVYVCICRCDVTGQQWLDDIRKQI